MRLNEIKNSKIERIEIAEIKCKANNYKIRILSIR